MLRGIDLPDLLHADAVFLRSALRIEAEARDQLLGERAAGSLGVQHVFAAQFHAGFVGVGGRAVGGPAEFAGDNALHFPARPENEFGTGHAGKDLDAEGLRTLREPAADIAHRDDVVAMVRQERRHGPVRQPPLPRRTEQIEFVPADLGGDRRAAVTPVGEQEVEPAGIEHRARKNMRADLGPLLEDDDRKVAVELLQPDRCRKTGRTGADDDHVIVRRLALRSPRHHAGTPRSSRLSARTERAPCIAEAASP